MKNQSTKTRVRKSNTNTVKACWSMPIKPKSSIIDAPQKDKMKRQHHQPAGDHTVCAPTPNSTQVKKQPKELKK